MYLRIHRYFFINWSNHPVERMECIQLGTANSFISKYVLVRRSSKLDTKYDYEKLLQLSDFTIIIF